MRPTPQAQDVVKEVWAFMESIGLRNPEVRCCLEAPSTYLLPRH